MPAFKQNMYLLWVLPAVSHVLMWLFQDVGGGRNITTALTYLLPSLMQLTYNIRQNLQNIKIKFKLVHVLLSG
jgi:hypothetical protein